MPLVSVIMPCFNHVKYVEESIKSVLAQTEKDLELIVVDDGSIDGSAKIIEAARTKDNRIKPIYFEKNRGASEARNAGLKAATGKYVAFCDADDLWNPDKLALQLEAIAPYPEIGAVYSDAEIINRSGEKMGEKFSDRFPVPGNGSGNLFVTLCVRNFINMASALVRSRCITEENYFNSKIKWVEDWLFWIKLSRSYSFIYIPEPLGLYRVHEASSAVAQPEGVIRNRVLVFLEILRLPDLPREILSKVFYHMGVALGKLKDSTAAFSYKESLKYNPFNWRAIARLILCTYQK